MKADSPLHSSCMVVTRSGMSTSDPNSEIPDPSGSSSPVVADPVIPTPMADPVTPPPMDAMFRMMMDMMMRQDEARREERRDVAEREERRLAMEKEAAAVAAEREAKRLEFEAKRVEAELAAR